MGGLLVVMEIVRYINVVYVGVSSCVHVTHLPSPSGG